MKNMFAMLAIAAIMTLPACPMLDVGKTVAADADTIIAKGKTFEGPRGFKDVPKPPGWSNKPKKSAQIEVLPGGMILAKGFNNVPVNEGKPWSGKDKGK